MLPGSQCATQVGIGQGLRRCRAGLVCARGGSRVQSKVHAGSGWSVLKDPLESEAWSPGWRYWKSCGTLKRGVQGVHPLRGPERVIIKGAGWSHALFASWVSV